MILDFFDASFGAILNVFIVKKPNPLFIFFISIFPLLTKWAREIEFASRREDGSVKGHTNAINDKNKGKGKLYSDDLPFILSIAINYGQRLYRMYIIKLKTSLMEGKIEIW